MSHIDAMLLNAILVIALSALFAVAIFIGDYVIPFIAKQLHGELQPKQRVDYAEKEWIKMLSSSSE